MDSSDRPKGKRSSQLTPLADVLQGLLENGKMPLANSFTRWRLEQNWPQIVGKTIGEQTLPCSYKRGILYIWVRHSAWLQQLWYFQDSIAAKVNEYLGQEWVKGVRFTTDRKAAVGDLKNMRKGSYPGTDAD